MIASHPLAKPIELPQSYALSGKHAQMNALFAEMAASISPDTESCGPPPPPPISLAEAPM